MRPERSRRLAAPSRAAAPAAGKQAAHGIIKPEAIDVVFSDLEARYRAQQLNSAAAMAEYLRHHASGADRDMILQRLRSLIDEAPEGSA